jgi:hypothetical protein
LANQTQTLARAQIQTQILTQMGSQASFLVGLHLGGTGSQLAPHAPGNQNPNATPTRPPVLCSAVDPATPAET